MPLGIQSTLLTAPPRLLRTNSRVPNTFKNGGIFFMAGSRKRGKSSFSRQRAR